MKTFYKIIPVFFISLFYSCVAPYQMTTTFNEKGEVTRDIYTAVNTAITPATDTIDLSVFPFSDPGSWMITQTDTSYVWYAGKAHPVNLWARKQYASLTTAQEEMMKVPMREFFSPQEQFRKQFRWFYTYYSYEACFPEIEDKGKIPLENYLSRDEMEVWLTGSNRETFFRGMNGMEINQILQEIEAKFLTWLKQNLFEVAWEVLENQLKADGLPADLNRMEQVNREEFFNKWFVKKEYSPDEDREVSAGTIAELLDKEFKTINYTSLYLAHKDTINKKVDEWWNQMEPEQGIVLKYQINLPGNLLCANTELIEEGMPFWRITRAAILPDAYTVSAQSRQANPWAFIITFALIAVLIGFIVLRKRKHK